MAAEAIELTRKDLENHLPHRGRNMLIDEVGIADSELRQHGTGSLLVAADDPLGRDFFLHDVPGVGSCLQPAAMLEHVALAALGVLQLDSGTITVFSRIRSARFQGRVRAGQRLDSATEGRKAPKPFTRFFTRIFVDDQPVCECDVMAYIPTGDSDAAAAAETPDTPPAPPVDAPARRVEHIAKLYPNKPADFVFVDAPLAIADDGLSGEFSYCYPTDHPLTAGHFPGSPIMMGVSQLTAVQDAAQWLLHRLREQGRLGELPEKVKVSGQLLALDDALICSVDGLGLRLFADTDVTELTSVKSVSFRRMVRPPEAMRVKVTLSL